MRPRSGAPALELPTALSPRLLRSAVAENTTYRGGLQGAALWSSSILHLEPAQYTVIGDRVLPVMATSGRGPAFPPRCWWACCTSAWVVPPTVLFLQPCLRLAALPWGPPAFSPLRASQLGHSPGAQVPHGSLRCALVSPAAEGRSRGHGPQLVSGHRGSPGAGARVFPAAPGEKTASYSYDSKSSFLLIQNATSVHPGGVPCHLTTLPATTCNDNDRTKQLCWEGLTEWCLFTGEGRSAPEPAPSSSAFGFWRP